jgi:alkylation response protein AidB-like acyl-CoA dehydrogenase
MSAHIDVAERIDPEELRDSARRLLADQVDRRAGLDQPQSEPGAALLGEMANLGWLLLTAPAARGGLDQSFEALAPIYEEMGRALAPLSIALTMAAVDVLRDQDGGPGAQLLDRIIAGEARVVAVFLSGAEAPVQRSFLLVPDGISATDLLILPESGQARLINLRGPGVRIEQIETWDRSRSFADIHLDDVEPTPLAGDGAAASRVARAHHDLAIAWDSIGGAQQALDEAIAYMGTRKQFGRPIGSFQALKHRAADLKVRLEVARALAQRASAAFAERSGAWADLAGQAHLLAVDSYRAITEESVQFHGGIGFTWEHDCHQFLKRALMNEVLGGTPEQIRDRVAPGILERALKR